MSTVTLKNIDSKTFSNALTAVDISVSHGRHFHLTVGGQIVSTTMKELTGKFNELTATGKCSEARRDRIQNALIILNFRADAMLKNSDWCTRFNAAIRRFFGGTSGKHYHLDQLAPVKPTPIPTENWVKELLDANLIPSDSALGAKLNSSNLDYRTARIEHEIAELLPKSIKNDQFCAKKHEARKAALNALSKGRRDNAELERADRTLMEMNHLHEINQDLRVALFNEIAKSYPLTACYQFDSNKFFTAEKLAIMARVDVLNKIIKKAFQEIDKLKDNK